MNRKHLPFIFALLVLLSGCSAEEVTQKVDANCGNMKTVISMGIQRLNYCIQDSDCVVHDINVCPFGCYQLHNETLSFAETAASMQKYANVCERCEQECGPLPEPEQVKCMGGKCVAQ